MRDTFQSELVDGEIVHRRDIEPAFLTIAAEIYRAVSMRAQAAANVSPRLDPSDSTPAVAARRSNQQQRKFGRCNPQPSGPTTRPSLGDGYAALHSSNFVEHSTASRLHARLVSHRVHILERKRSVAIDARGQLAIDKGLRKSDTPARRAKLSSDQAQKTLIRRRTGHANHGLAGLPNDPPAQPAAPTGPVQFVPRKTNEFSSTDESPSLMTGDEEWPPDDDDSAVDARQPSSETARTSPPLGTSLLSFFTSVVGTSVNAGVGTSVETTTSVVGTSVEPLGSRHTCRNQHLGSRHICQRGSRHICRNHHRGSRHICRHHSGVGTPVETTTSVVGTSVNTTRE